MKKERKKNPLQKYRERMAIQSIEVIDDQKPTYEKFQGLKDQEFDSLSMTQNDLQITLTGNSEDVMMNDLKLRSILLLTEGLDFRFLEEEGPEIKDKYFMTIISQLGEVMKWEMPNGKGVSALEFVRDYINWLLETKLNEVPEYSSFLEKYCPKDDDEELF